MIALLDADILIDVALDREPFSADSSAVLDAAERREFRAFVAWHAIANLYYIVVPSSGRAETREFVKDLLEFVNVAPTTTSDAVHAASLDMSDFEDALQAAAAGACRAQVIVTRNTRHYRKSPVPAVAPRTFLRRYLRRRSND